VPPLGTVDEVVVDCADPARLAAFWQQVLGGEVVARDAGWHRLDPPGWSSLAFQRVPERKAVKNRLHLDVRVDDLAAATDAARRLGAVPVGPPVHDVAGSFQVLLDPEGNEWCLVRPPGS
jgi:catechol 2,3-dioxygenase-like lactoylglutathione lyase family enzyme